MPSPLCTPPLCTQSGHLGLTLKCTGRLAARTHGEDAPHKRAQTQTQTDTQTHTNTHTHRDTHTQRDTHTHTHSLSLLLPLGEMNKLVNSQLPFHTPRVAPPSFPALETRPPWHTVLHRIRHKRVLVCAQAYLSGLVECIKAIVFV